MSKSKNMEAEHSQAKTNWITPPLYLDAVRKVFGKRIALDVASDANANKIVNAVFFYTEADNGLSKPWIAPNVYCNPPGSDKPGVSAILPWLDKMTDDHLKGRFIHGILCAFNVDTSTKWFQRCANRYPISLPGQRIRFLRDDLTPSSKPVHPSAFIYIGNNDPVFCRVFEQFGVVIPSQIVRR